MKSPRRMPATASRTGTAEGGDGAIVTDLVPGMAELPLDALQLDVASYVESVSAELRAMARSARLDGLAYFLDMVRTEASIQVERLGRRDE